MTTLKMMQILQRYANCDMFPKKRCDIGKVDLHDKIVGKNTKKRHEIEL